MAGDLLARLKRAGLTVAKHGDRLVVAPSQRITAEIRAAIRASKDELLTSLDDAQSVKRVSAYDLEHRITDMARRWGYTVRELEDALADAKSNPHTWLLWTEQDEQDFGGCVTAEDFAAQYLRTRRLT